MRRLVLRVLLSLCLLTLLSAYAATAAPKIYVDTSAIDARTDMTAAQKTAVKDAMKNELKSNLESAFGAGSVEVTDDPAQKGSADRTVTVDAGIGSSTSGGKTSYHWGEWPHGSSGVTVHLGTYMDSAGTNNGADFKSGDPPTWDTTKLGKALGTTAAHETAHSYSAGHDDRPANPPDVQNPNKMNTSNTSAQIGGGLPLNKAAKDTLSANKSKAPCAAATDYKSVCCMADWWSDPQTTLGAILYEPLAVTALFTFYGPITTQFDFGWWGADTDNGATDGNPWADFVYKSSMTGTTSDSPTITFFDGWTATFVLRGRPDTPYAGKCLPVQVDRLHSSDPVTRPDGSIVDRQVHMTWDIDRDGLDDVNVGLSTWAYGADSPPNGFILGLAKPLTPGQAKLKVDGTCVRMMNVVVSRILGDCFYVQALDRSSGIGVRMGQGLPIPPIVVMGGVYDITGKIETVDDCERAITVLLPEDIVQTGMDLARPLGMPNRSLGGSDYNYVAGLWPSGQRGVQGGTGLNNIGLLVRTCGRIKEFDPDPQPTWFVIDDGSGVDVRCEAPHGVTVQRTWAYVGVTGISRLYGVAEEYKRLLSIGDARDITVLQENPPGAPVFVFGCHTNDMPTQWISLVANWPDGAASMTVYQSADKITWSPTSIPVVNRGGAAFATFEQWSNSYFRFTAVNSGGESAPSDIIHARPFEVEHGSIIVDWPAPEGVTGISLIPTFSWTPDWHQSVTLKSYYTELHTEMPWETIWAAMTTTAPPPTSVVYGQTEGMLTVIPAVPLSAYTLYHYYMCAMDSENWWFATCHDRHFTTGP